MKKLIPFLTALAFLFVTCTPTYIYKESENPRYCRPDPRARYHCTTPEDCDRYFEALGYHARLNNEAQQVNVIDHRGFILQGKMYEKPAAERMIFDGSVYDPRHHKWMHDVRFEMAAP
jgi:hypothetical protein